MNNSRNQALYNKRSLIKLALRDRAQEELDWVLTRYQRWFYVFKIILCILFNKSQRRDSIEYNALDVYPIVVGLFDCNSFYHPAHCWELKVGNGYFKHWFYLIEREGYYDAG